MSYHRNLRVAFSLALALVAAPVVAQIEDPAVRVKEISDEIATEMAAIDRLLLSPERARGDNAAEGMRQVNQKIDELLKQATDAQGGVVDKIDDLISVLEQMQKRGQGGPPQDRNDEQQRGDQPQQRRQETPEAGNPAARNRPDERPDDNQPDPKSLGQNRLDRDQRSDPTERVPHSADTDRWGLLPLYEELLRSRGGRAEVPERYRKFHDAFLKRGRKRSSGTEKR